MLGLVLDMRRSLGRATQHRLDSAHASRLLPHRTAGLRIPRSRQRRDSRIPQVSRATDGVRGHVTAADGRPGVCRRWQASPPRVLRLGLRRCRRRSCPSGCPVESGIVTRRPPHLGTGPRRPHRRRGHPSRRTLRTPPVRGAAHEARRTRIATHVRRLCRHPPR